MKFFSILFLFEMFHVLGNEKTSLATREGELTRDQEVINRFAERFD